MPKIILFLIYPVIFIFTNISPWVAIPGVAFLDILLKLISSKDMLLMIAKREEGAIKWSVTSLILHVILGIFFYWVIATYL